MDENKNLGIGISNYALESGENKKLAVMVVNEIKLF